MNDRLIVSGLAIEKINIIRKHLSAVKGGRLGALTRHGATTFIHSDVSAGHPEMAGSGPTVADLSTNADAAEILEGLGDERCIDVARRLRDPGVPETIKVADAPVVIADNATLVRAAAEAIVARGHAVQTIEEEIAGDVADCANALYTKSRQLPHGTFLVAGGEATVRVTKPGRGGRCSELALRVAALALSKCDPAIFALFGSSDGIDGTSGTAGAIIDPRRYQAVTIAAIERALSECDSARLLDKTGEAIMIPPTGNNLRDLYILARG